MLVSRPPPLLTRVEDHMKNHVSGVYRPEDDHRNKPLPSIKQIVDSAIAAKRHKKAQHLRTTSRGTPAHKRAYDRMVGSA